MSLVVTIRAGEKIPVPGTYGNVTIEAEVSKTFPDGTDEKEALREVADLTEEFVAEERQVIYDSFTATAAK